MRGTPPRQRPLPGRFFRGGELLRLVSMITMLGVIYFLMVRMRDPSMWKWLAPDDENAQAAAEPPAPEKTAPGKPATGKPSPEKPGTAAEPPPAPAASGPTDEDPEERDAFKEEVQAVDDNTLHLQPIEMEAYDRLVRWSVDQPVQRMFQRAEEERPRVRFNDFVQHRKELRGKLVHLDLSVRRVLKSEIKTRDGVQLYEMWGFSNESQPWLYCVIAVDLPKDIPLGERVQEDVRVVGYFLKLQGYQPAIGKPNDIYFAPLIIGKVIPVVVPAPLAKEDISLQTGLVILAGIVLVIGGSVLWGLSRRHRRKGGVQRIETAIPRPEGIAIDDWFDRVQAGQAPPGNNPEGFSDSNSGAIHRPAGRNGDSSGEGNGHARLFPDGLDSGPSQSE